VRVEPGEKTVFKMKSSCDAKNTWNRRILPECEAGGERGPHVMSVDQVGADVGDELTASAKRGWDAPGLARGKIEIGANDSRSGFAIFWGEAFGVGGQSDDYFDSK
jgi:hypothetical protein